ncbi:helix-turn-helix domain-containing protein [Nostoc sp.]|uniref:helix-turn-helix domain-containing protein n=1 Tax=Nostoc sp. TaxID=1180 RepID=UPI002FFC6846
MRVNIRERSQKVLQCLCEKTQQSLRKIAVATGIPKSSVHRHMRTIKQRQKYDESHLWETQEGGDWLRLLVFAVIYCFGIKGGIGSESLSTFFRLLHLEERIGCSASALRELEVQVKEQIIAYGEAQAQANHGSQPIGICVGADETFYGLPILVAMELASGFIFSEIECENRTYQTWWEQVSQWFSQEQWECRALLSDGAKALIKLALNGLGCPSLPDVFHLLYAVSKSMGSAIARQQMRLQKQLQALQEKLKADSKKMSQVQAQITAVQAQQQKLETDHLDYQQSLHALSQAIHPFNLNTCQSQFGLELPTVLQAPLQRLADLSQTYAPTQSQLALARWQRQIPDLSRTLHA